MAAPALLSVIGTLATPTVVAARRYVESIIWMLALLLLFFLNPSEDLPSVCVFKLVGFESCPGCGIGHAIHFALHFKFQQSLSEHIFGIPATIGILYHLFYSFQKLKQNNLKWTNNKCL